jgi:kynurenine formamidase
VSNLIDLSHPIEHGMTTYPGFPTPVITEWITREASRARYAEGTTFQITRIDMVANTGTYIDAPVHRFESGADIGDYPLAAVADLEGIVIRAKDRSGPALDVDHFSRGDLKGKAVLVHTGWDAHWRKDSYGSGHPFLTRAAAEYLVQAGVALVGIDSMNIDDASDGTRPVHTALLRARIAIVEHMCNLGALPDTGFHFFAVPPAVKGMASFPVRAFALVR